MNKLLYCTLIILALSNPSFATENKPTFPSDYFDSNDEPSKPNTVQNFQQGKQGDEFIKTQDFDLKKFENGNLSDIIKCPCPKGKKSCKQSTCHQKPLILQPEPQQAGKIQYRFIPVPTESDEQINPYFMMLSRQRLIANTTKETPQIVKPESKAPTQAAKAPIPVAKQMQLMDIRPNYRFYGAFSFAYKSTGSTSFTSSEQPAIINTNTGLITPNGNMKTNFSLDKDYTKITSLSVAGGLELRTILASAIRLELSSVYSKGSGQISNFKNQVAISKPSDEYGNFIMYQAGFSAHFDLFRYKFKLYPSYGKGSSIGSITFLGSGGSSASKDQISIKSTYFHINYDISDNTTLFVGNRTSIISPFNAFNEKTDVLNAVDTDRMLYDRQIYAKETTINTTEIGLRFY
ncbi:hypothetical protein [Candidatus Deianiraea vastatrix]|uniref:Outer membrane protein beta-barrel domain-containing protein n=1 Tax=Candidatus Deianiraea vastatrix TaxID=2163644 RepID=A0A5B8XI46_9RICK|nr:hypothetical protein [Candidatus Deianiraea vastatrix]QED23694.1 hypothetical protein Deia_00907 [Candidatus Deianiraea vastatrix]